MIAFDTDVLTEILRGNPTYVARAATIPTEEQCVPIVVVEEIMRGRLKSIRRAESGGIDRGIEHAYEVFAETVDSLRRVQMLRYDRAAHAKLAEWRQQRLRLGTHDLRIAAICVSHAAKLISRNRSDFQQVPELDLEFWD